MANLDTSERKTILLKSFGNRVRYLRKEAGLTQEELAFRCGIHINYLSSVERGERNIALKNIAAIADAFGISISKLVDLEIPSKGKKAAI